MPESDPGDGEIGNAEEFLRELDRVEYDDTLLGLVGDGYDVNAPGDQAVADFLGAWRDDVRRVPLDRSQMPSAHTARGSLPPTLTPGEPMSIMDDAQHIGAMSNDHTAISAIKTAKQHLLDAIQALVGAQQHITDTAGTAAALLGGPDGEQIQGQGQQAAQEVSNLTEQIDAADKTADDVVRFATAFNAVLREQATKHGG
jgi:hypothetical protein